MEWVNATASVMRRLEERGLARCAYKTSAAIHEYAFHHHASDPPIEGTGVANVGGRLHHDVRVFNQRHWRLTDARIRVFGALILLGGVPALGGDASCWARTLPLHYRRRRRRGHPHPHPLPLPPTDGYAATQMERNNITVIDHWSPSRAWPKIHPDAIKEPRELNWRSTNEASTDMRHHAPETLLGAIAELATLME